MTRKSKFRLFYLIADTFSILIGTLLLNMIRFYWEDPNGVWATLGSYLFNTKSYLVYFSLWLFWLLLFTLSGYYNKPLNKSRIEDVWTTFSTVLLGTGVEFLLLVVDDQVHDTRVYLQLYLLLLLSTFFLVYLFRFGVTRYAIHQRGRKEFWPKVLLVGTREQVEKVAEASHEMRFIVQQQLFFEDYYREDGKTLSLEEIDKAVALIFKSAPPSEIYLASTQEESSNVGHLLYKLYPYRTPIKITAEGMMPLPFIETTFLQGIPLVDVTETKMSEGAKNIKWCWDRVVSFLLLVVLSPLFLLLSILVRKSSKGPVFFAQERIGKRGKPFKIYKFRTMYVDSEKNGPQLSYDGDRRITPIGRVLRKYRLDELPQLFNVLKADMSFVGPRPERQFYIDLLVDKAPYYYLLHNVLPGITSWGMVRYGYASNLDEMTERLRYDWLYYGNMSLKMDLTVLFYTISVLLKGAGK